MAYKKGIDLSHHNSVTSWSSIKNSGVSFVFLKATEGVGYTDPTFKARAVSAKNAGLLVGAYHFARFSSVEDATAEARYFVSVVKDSDLSLPHVLDIEVDDNGLSLSTMNACIKNFIEEVERLTKHRTIIYSGKWFMTQFTLPAGVPFWYARYFNSSTPDVACTYWQYTDSGSVAGVSGGVDCNYLIAPEHPSVDLGGIPVPDAPEDTADQASPFKGVVEVLADTLNVRTGASTSYPVVKQITKGQKYKCYAVFNNWYNLGGDQWAYAGSNGEYLDVTQGIGIVTVTADVLNLRSGIGTQYDVIQQIYKGESYKAYDYKDGWYKVGRGWCSGTYLDFKPY